LQNNLVYIINLITFAPSFEHNLSDSPFLQEGDEDKTNKSINPNRVGEKPQSFEPNESRIQVRQETSCKTGEKQATSQAARQASWKPSESKLQAKLQGRQAKL